MFKKTSIYFCIALGLLCHTTHGVANEPEHEVLVVVVESKAWLGLFKNSFVTMQKSMAGNQKNPIGSVAMSWSAGRF